MSASPSGGVVREQLVDRHQEARRAEAALETVLLGERLLDRMKRRAGGREALDGHQLVPLRLYGEHQAGPHGPPVDENGAGAAHAVLAAEVRAGQVELVAQEVRERGTRLGRAVQLLAVHPQRQLTLRDAGQLRVPDQPCARPTAVVSARRVRTPARCRR